MAYHFHVLIILIYECLLISIFLFHNVKIHFKKSSRNPVLACKVLAKEWTTVPPNPPSLSIYASSYDFITKDDLVNIIG